MAHFAELNPKNVVLRVIVVGNNDVDNLPFPESEPIGIAFCQSIFGADTRWAQTSYNASFRHNYACAGFVFDPTAQAFIPPKPFSSWLLNTSTYQWAPPVPYPSDDKTYVWDETTQSWVTPTD